MQLINFIDNLPSHLLYLVSKLAVIKDYLAPLDVLGDVLILNKLILFFKFMEKTR